VFYVRNKETTSIEHMEFRTQHLKGQKANMHTSFFTQTARKQGKLKPLWKKKIIKNNIKNIYTF
jgi:hypothetical protein